MSNLATFVLKVGNGSNEGNTGPQNQAQRTQSVSPIGLVVNGLHCAASHTHTTSLKCHPTFETCPKSPIMQMMVTAGQHNRPHCTHSVSPLGLFVNVLHSYAANTH